MLLQRRGMRFLVRFRGRRPHARRRCGPDGAGPWQIAARPRAFRQDKLHSRTCAGACRMHPPTLWGEDAWCRRDKPKLIAEARGS